MTQTFGPIEASRIGGLYDDVHAYEYYDHLADTLGGSWSFGPKRFPYLTTPMGNAKLVAWADPVMDQGHKVRRTTQGPIQLNGLFADTPGSGLGTAIMNASKDFADRTGRPFNVGMVANKRFFNTERFPWMHQPNEWSPDLRYDPQSATEFGPKIGSSHLGASWQPPSYLWDVDRFGPMPQDREGTLNWTPGSPGKGAIIDGVPHTWNTENLGGSPHHQQYIRTLAEGRDVDDNASDWVVIGPGGHYTADGFSAENPVDPSMFARVQPGLRYVRDPNRWQIREGAYYHVAPTSVRDDFQAQGPRLADPQANPQWDGFNVNGGDPRFYAWNSLPVAEQYRDRLTEHRGQPHDIWEINAPGGWFDEDPEIYYKDAEREFGPGAQSLMYKGDKPLTDYRRVGSTSTMNWTPGSWGKGLILDGQLHTWNTDHNPRYGPRMGEPHHGEFLTQHGLAREDRDRWSDRIIIGPTGHYTVNDPEEFWQTPERFAQAHPALKFVRDPYRWENRVSKRERHAPEAARLRDLWNPYR